MQLYHDDIISIELYAQAPCLIVQWQDMEFFNISDFELAFNTIMNFIGEHQTKKVILDMSKSIIGPPDKFYNSSVDLLMSGFGHHEVEKLGRVSSQNEARENRFTQYTTTVIAGMQLNLDFQLFKCRNTALQWINQ